MAAKPTTQGGASMLDTVRKSAMTVAALGALGLGGAALASDLAAKVKAAALDKVPGATVLRTEAGGPNGAAYHAHIRTSGGALKVVLVDSSFKATAVLADQGRPGGRRHGGP